MTMDSGAIKEMCRRAGAVAAGIAAVGPVEDKAAEAYRRWIESGGHGGMLYLEKYTDIRRNPELLLSGAKTVICCAFAYTSPEFPRSALFADYALGDDYHEVLREALAPVADALGGETRICIDTAPLRERYWAVCAGVGFIGVNNQLIVPGVGSGVFLAEILWTGTAEADKPLETDCLHCGACVKACPGSALDGQGSMDARKCLSYLTIEHRGAFPEPSQQLPGRIYGCDICRDVCPLGRSHTPVYVLPALRPRSGILALTLADVKAMDQEKFSAIFRRSAVRRAKLAGLLRNAVAKDPDDKS